ncbi:MAG: helix-turn-helix transcriptional regulator, partial [Desulfotignum sp.]|nr:helix-turn-helix transcriptional regulator [Desulfotignum sp.]
MSQYIDIMLTEKEIFTKWLKKKIKIEEATTGVVLAQKVGVHPSTISGWFSRKSKGPEKKIRLKICEFFQVNHDDIVGKKKKEKSAKQDPKIVNIDRQHWKVVEQFQQKDTALQINQALVELEKVDPSSLESMLEMV